MPDPTSTIRLEVPISIDLHRMLKIASELQGRTVAEFAVAAMRDAAWRAIEEIDIVNLSPADQECFANALLSPPSSSPALNRAFDRRRNLLRGSPSLPRKE